MSNLAGVYFFQESFQQTKATGRFASRFAKQASFLVSEFGALSLEKRGEFTKVGAIREFTFFYEFYLFF